MACNLHKSTIEFWLVPPAAADGVEGFPFLRSVRLNFLVQITTKGSRLLLAGLCQWSEGTRMEHGVCCVLLISDEATTDDAILAVPFKTLTASAVSNYRNLTIKFSDAFWFWSREGHANEVGGATIESNSDFGSIDVA